MPEPGTLGKDKNGDNHIQNKNFSFLVQKKWNEENKGGTSANKGNEQMNFGIQRGATMNMIIKKIAYTEVWKME